MEEERDGASGYQISHILSEIVDNSYDAESPTIHIATIQGNDGYYTVFYDKGHGAKDLMDVFGAGAKIIKKANGKRGLKNRGGRGAAGAMTDRKSIIYVSKPVGAVGCSTLTVDFEGLYAAIDAMKMSEDRDMNNINTAAFFRNTIGAGLTDKIRTLVQNVILNTGSEQIRADMSGVLDNSTPHYFMMIARYTSQPPALESAMRDAINSYRLFYHRALEAGRSLEFYTESPLILTGANAVDPLGSTKPRLYGSIEFRLPPTAFDAAGMIVNTAAATIHFTVENDAVAANYWLLPNTKWTSGDRRTIEGALIAAPPEWELMIPVTRMTYAFSVVSKEEEEEQKQSLGSLMSKTEQLRGVYLVYIDRCLGMPVYSPRWEGRRNAGGVRCEITCGGQVGAEHFWRIQNKKHSSEFEQLHPMMQAFLHLLVGRTIIDKFSNSGKKGENSGVSEWDFDKFCDMIENPAKRAYIPPPIPAPISLPLPLPLPLPLSLPLPEPEPQPSMPKKQVPLPMSAVSSYKRTIPKSQADVVSALAELKTLMANFSPNILIKNTDTTTAMTLHHKSIMAVSELIKKLNL